MNDEFSVCGVERPDDRTAEGPPPILKSVLSRDAAAATPARPSFHTSLPPDTEIRGKFAGLCELNRGVNG